MVGTGGRAGEAAGRGGTWRPEERGEGQRTRAPLLRQPSLHRLVLLARLRDLRVGAGDGGAQDRLLVADDGAAPRVERHLQQLLVVHDQHLGDHGILGLHVRGVLRPVDFGDGDITVDLEEMQMKVLMDMPVIGLDAARDIIELVEALEAFSSGARIGVIE